MLLCTCAREMLPGATRCRRCRKHFVPVRLSLTDAAESVTHSTSRAAVCCIRIPCTVLIVPLPKPRTYRPVLSRTRRGESCKIYKYEEEKKKENHVKVRLSQRRTLQIATPTHAATAQYRKQRWRALHLLLLSLVCQQRCPHSSQQRMKT